MCICLYAWGFASHSRMFHSYWDVTIAGEGLQILTHARHSWPLSNEGSLACHIYCDTGQPFIMVISEDPWHSQLLPNFWSSGAFTTCFYFLGHKIVALIATDLLFSPFRKTESLSVKVHVKVLISTFVTTQILAYDNICQKHCQVVTNRVTVLVTSQEFRTGTTSYFRFPVQAIPQNCSYGSLII